MGRFTLWQLPAQTPGQMMSYVLQTDGRKIIVIDGGTAGDAPFLRGFLAALGSHVHAWFVTHPHSDHVDALTAILTDPRGLTIDAIYGSIPDLEWVEKYEPAPVEHPACVRAFNQALGHSDRRIVQLSPAQVMTIDGVRIEILGVKNPEIKGNAINNSSVVMRVAGASKSVLFTGDLGVEGGDKLLGGPYRDRLIADYVQMAHHGQHGVSEEFYRAVQPKYCLWPTPRWLWDNDAGQGPGSGPWVTRTVRAWIRKLEVRKNYVSADGLVQIR